MAATPEANSEAKPDTVSSWRGFSCQSSQRVVPSGGVGAWNTGVLPNMMRATMPDVTTVSATESVCPPNHGIRTMSLWRT